MALRTTIVVVGFDFGTGRRHKPASRDEADRARQAYSAYLSPDHAIALAQSHLRQTLLSQLQVA